MRTTLDLDDRLAKEAKRRAVEEGTTLTALLERGLRLVLHAPRTGKPFRYRPLAKAGRALAGVDLDDRDALYERMEERR
jgi:hypothetical protein